MSTMDIAFQSLGAGVQTEFGTWLNPGALVTYVHHSAGRAQDIEPIRSRTYSTLNSALLHCRSGAGDVVAVLPGHAESFSAADSLTNLVAGTQIIGLGHGTLRPTFTWSAAGSTVLFDVADVKIRNCILNMEPGTGSVTVTARITVSAAGCQILDCEGRFSTDANNKVTIGITTTAAADGLTLKRNHFYGATAGECTTFLDIIGVDRLCMEDNVIEGATSATTVGIIRFATTASLNIRQARNSYLNRKALSTAAVTGLAGVSGVGRDEHVHYLDTSSLTAWLTSAGIMTQHRPTVTNTA